jgi:hypothetical protein
MGLVDVQIRTEKRKNPGVQMAINDVVVGRIHAGGAHAIILSREVIPQVGAVQVNVGFVGGHAPLVPGQSGKDQVETKEKQKRRPGAKNGAKRAWGRELFGGDQKLPLNRE